MTIPSDDEFMGEALREAALAGTEREVPIGAVLVREGRIVARGHNACERRQDATAHAEMIAISAASAVLGSWRLEHCTLYVTIEPCPMCMGAALNARVARIVYGAPEPKAGACGSVVDLRQPPGFNHHLEVTAGVRAEEAGGLLVSFFRALRQERRDR